MQAGTTLLVQVSSGSRLFGESVSSPLDRIHALAVSVGGQRPSVVQRPFSNTDIVLMGTEDTLLLSLHIVDVIR